MIFRELALRPNCLLTRRPLLLHPGPQSLWKWRNPWKRLHRFLYLHGYALAKNSETAVHLICGSNLPVVIPEGSTLTVISKTLVGNLPKNAFHIPIDLTNTAQNFDRILDHCIHLAELDYLED